MRRLPAPGTPVLHKIRFSHSSPPPELAQITANAKRIFCKIQQVLFEQGSIIEEVYFPLTGLASMVVVLSDGTTIEALTIGREGFVGVPLIHDVPTARYRGVCQVEGEFLVMDAQVFLGMIGSLSDLRRRLLRYSQYASGGRLVARLTRGWLGVNE